METIFERKLEYTRPLRSYQGYLKPHTFSFGLDIQISGSKTTLYTHTSPLVTYASYTIQIKLNSWCATDGPNGWSCSGRWYDPYGGTTHNSSGIYINTNKEINTVLDYLKKLELSESDFTNLAYLPTLQETIQQKLDSSNACPNQMSILCKETEHLHKINQELREQISQLRPNFAVDSRLEIEKLQKDKTTYHSCGFWEYGKDSTLHEKIRVLEIENAGKTRQLRKLEIDIAKLKESKQTDAMSFTQANTIGQALMHDSTIYNCNI